MSDETDTTAGMVYVVQQEQKLGVPEADGKGVMMHVDAWVDIRTVEVPPRTKRATVIKRALAEAKITPNLDGTMPRLRALDADSFEVHEPEAHQPPMEWRL